MQICTNIIFHSKKLYLQHFKMNMAYQYLQTNHFTWKQIKANYYKTRYADLHTQLTAKRHGLHKQLKKVKIALSSAFAFFLVYWL